MNVLKLKDSNYSKHLLKSSFGLVVLLFLIISCATDNKNQDDNPNVTETETIEKTNFPDDLIKVFNEHGGFENWQKMKSLRFSMMRNNGVEITITDLTTRTELIDHPDFMIGYNAENLWVLNKSEEPYEGNAKFYRGLMFYFYAMPFVLGDDGIIYSKAEPLEFEDESYPGIRISYKSGVGVSPDDEYILYYNKDTYQMEWLAYTVTFGKDGKSDDFHFIRYKYWQNINGLKLPNSISWYTYEELRNTIVFKDVTLSEEKPESELFEMPEGDLIVD